MTPAQSSQALFGCSHRPQTLFCPSTVTLSKQALPGFMVGGRSQNRLSDSSHRAIESTGPIWGSMRSKNHFGYGVVNLLEMIRTVPVPRKDDEASLFPSTSSGSGPPRQVSLICTRTTPELIVSNV